ncbi:MAG: hypothetical protein AAGD96_32700, partial [Chloroflexota bacterium]
MQISNRVEEILNTDSGLRLCLDFGQIDIAFPQTGILHLKTTFDTSPFILPVDGEVSQAPSSVLKDWHDAPKILDGFSLDMGDHSITFTSNPFTFTLAHAGDTLLKTLPGRTFFEDANGRRWHCHVKQDDDLYYGLGEKSGGLLRNNRSFRMNNVDAIGYDPEHGDPLYKHIPFYIKHASNLNHTIGIFCNNAANSQFDFGRERSGYWNPYTYICVDAGQFDLYFCLGPTPAEVLKQYHQITGFPALPTKRSLGYLG